MADLEREFKYYIDNQDELIKKYRGKFIVIKDQKVIGVFDSDLEAVEKTSQEHELGTFLVQECNPGSSNYTFTFHSRVTFV
ncbi:DUF5678 domain-containing protein [Chloroflexota bacterium]